MTIKIIEVFTDSDIKTTASLATEIWREHYSHIITKEQIEYMLDNFQSEQAIREQISSGDLQYYLMMLDDATVGYLAVKEKAGKLFLSKFYILKSYRGNGYASRAIEWLTAFCKERGLHAIWLTVNRYNHSSIGVYEKKGFRKIRTQVADIGNGFVMDDYIMEKSIQ